MSITLIKLVAKGQGKPDSEIEFSKHNCLIRGGSDTGKSYIRDCLWYLLGGRSAPKSIPECKGYDSLDLEIKACGVGYLISRAIAGGGSTIREISENGKSEIVNVELNNLILRLSGANDKTILQSASKKGPITSGDLRHWFLLSQPRMISEDKTTGSDFNHQTRRMSAFYVFLTGKDDSAIELAITKAQKDRLTGNITSKEDAIKLWATP